MRISKYISGLLLILLCSNAYGQTPDAGEGGKDSRKKERLSVPPGERVRGLRVGYDLGGLVLLYSEPERSRHSFFIDYEIVQDIYPVLEFGFQQSNLKRDTYGYSSGGMFARLGADVNILKYDHPNVYEMFYVGFRYGLAYMTHEAKDIRISDDLYSDLTGLSVPENQLNAHWISFNTGLRVELFNNVFMGWNAMFNLKLAQTKDANMQPYNVAGFGKGDKRVALNIQYTIAYRIPLSTYRPKKVIRIGANP